MLSHVTTSYCVVTKWMFKILLTHRASVLSHFVAESDSAAVLMSLCPPAKQNKTNANVNGDKNLVFTWGKSHTNHKHIREVVKIKIFYGQPDRKGGHSASESGSRRTFSFFFIKYLQLGYVKLHSASESGSRRTFSFFFKKYLQLG